MRNKIKDTMSFRLFMFLWLFTIGTFASWAEDTSSSNGKSNETEEEIAYDFTANPEILQSLSSSYTDLNDENKRTLKITVNGYDFTFFNCLKVNNGKCLAIRGDYSNDNGSLPGYVQGSMKGIMTQMAITKRNAQGNGTIHVIIEDKNGKKTEISKSGSGSGTIIIDIPEDQQVEDAKSITLQTDFKLEATKISVKRKNAVVSLQDPWIVFKTLNADESKVQAFPTDDNSADANKAYCGQILQLESNGIEGFDPVSSMANPYVVTYTIGESEESTPLPEFSNVTDGKATYWKNGDDTYPAGYDGHQEGEAIGKQGIVYRRGIALNIEKNADGTLHIPHDQDIMTVKLGIFRVTRGEDGKTTAENIKYITKNFRLTKDDDKHEQPQWTANYGSSGTRYDLVFAPDTKQKTTPQDSKYSSNMTVLDPTQTITVTAVNKWRNMGNTIISKFSKNDKYNVQSLLNAHSISTATDVKNMKSTSLGMRKLTAMQFTRDGIVSQAVAEGFYWFVPSPKQLFLEVEGDNVETSADGNSKQVNLNIATGSETSKATITLKAYYLDENDNSKKVYVDPSLIGLKKSNTNLSDSDVADLDNQGSPEAETYFTFNTADKTATFVIKGLDNGTTNLTLRSEKVLNVNLVDYDTNTSDAISYLGAVTSLNINVSGGGNLMPPTITPYTQNYTHSFLATVKGYKPENGENIKTYYLLMNKSAATNMARSESSTVIPLLAELIEAVTEMDSPTDEYPAFGILDNDASASINIPANIGTHYVLCAAAVKANDTTTGSRVVSSDYTYNKLEAPILSPGVEGANHFHAFTGSLDVHANTETENSQIFYLLGNGQFIFNVKENGTIETNCFSYSAETPITLTGSQTIRAIAYNNALGITSEVVTYRYALMNADIDAPKFTVIDKTDASNNKVFTSGSKYFQSLANKEISIETSLYNADGTETVIGGASSNVNWNSDLYHIYYTTDGNYPTGESKKYEGPFTLDTSNSDIILHAIVIADGAGADHSVSDVSMMTFLNSKTNYWETTEVNCPQGILAEREQSITKDGETLVNIEFGGSNDQSGNNLKWKHYVSAEYATGNPLDNVGKYTIAPSTDANEEEADVRDEMGNLWNHSKSNDGTPLYQTHKATFGLPASGAYVKFEPKRSGKLTIWCCQEGALYYNNESKQEYRFNEGFLRKRPAYFVDERGKSIRPETVTAAGVLSSNWQMDASPTSWNKKGEEINGIKQTLYTQEQTAFIYQMFNNKILASNANWNTPLQPLIIYLHTPSSDLQKVAGFNVAENPRDESEKESTKAYATDDLLDNTGVCLPSASYMKYTFDVEAGKTYFFFGWMTKIGIRGFGFEPSTEAPSSELIIHSGKSGTDAGGDSKTNDFTAHVGKTFNQVKLDRSFTAGTWATLVLPFSVSASQVKDVFGDKTEILHYRTMTEKTIYFFEHYHQMIVAGTPIIIKPSQAVNTPVFSNVTIETAEDDIVVDKPSNDYNGGDESLCMKGSYKPLVYKSGDYYFTKTGTIKKLSDKAVQSTLGGTRAYIVGNGETITQNAKTAYNNPVPTSLDGNTTGIDMIGIGNGKEDELRGVQNENIYNISGQLMTKDASQLKGAAKGIYIVKGKKVILK